MDEIKKDLLNLNYSAQFNIANYEEQNVDLVLEDASIPTSTITGLVLDVEGNPVANATIKIFDSEGNPFLHTVTDDK